MAEDTAAAEIKTMSFEQALAELETIVETLEQGQGELDAAISAYERGIALKSHCEAKLTEAKLKVEKITLDAQGGVSAEPSDED
jgi:exodeoxyribonuclease VII small subunit